MIYVFVARNDIMDELEVHADQTNLCFTTMEAESETGSRKTSLSPQYWPFQCGTFC